MWNLLIGISFFLFSIDLFSATIGSDSAVSRISSKVTLNNGDRIAAFAGVEGGIELFSNTVVAIFDSVFPLSGDIDLNSGSLHLKQDLILDNPAAITWVGNIIGNGHALELAPTMTCIISGDEKQLDCKLELLFSSAITSALYAGSWSYDDKYVATTGPLNFTDDVEVYSFNESGITSQVAVDIGSGAAYALRWHPSKYCFAVGASTNGSGPELRIYDFDETGPSLTQTYTEEIGTLCTSVAWHPSGDYLAVGTWDATASVILYSVNAACELVPTFSVSLGPRLVYLQTMDWNSTGEYLSVGTNVSGGLPSVLVYSFDADAAQKLVLQATDTPSKLVWSTSWNQTHTDVLGVTYQGSGDNIELFQHNTTGLTLNDRLVKKTGITDSSVFYSSDWSPDGNCYAVGKNATVTTEIRSYAFNSSTFALTEVSGFESTTFVIDVQWSNHGEYLMTGGNGSMANFFKKAVVDCFVFSNLGICLNCDLCLKDVCVTFTGESTINGQGYVLDIQDSAKIVVGSEASLKFKDITVKGVQKTNIAMADSLSTISFDNAEFVLDADYSFAVGNFEAIREFIISGSGNTFAYKTDQQSDILACGKLILENGITFSYDPTLASGDLIALTEDTSKIIMRGATIHSTTTGLRLTKGILVVDDNSQFTSEATVESEAIVFGDGAISNNNLCVQWLAESGFELTSGFLKYQNV